MFQLVKIDNRGTEYPLSPPYVTRSEADAALARERISGRFVRCELWEVARDGNTWVPQGDGPLAIRTA